MTVFTPHTAQEWIYLQSLVPVFLLMIFIKFILWGFQNKFCLIPNPRIIYFINVWSFCNLKSKSRHWGTRNMVLKQINIMLECWFFACRDVLKCPITHIYDFWKIEKIDTSSKSPNEKKIRKCSKTDNFGVRMLNFLHVKTFWDVNLLRYIIFFFKWFLIEKPKWGNYKGFKMDNVKVRMLIFCMQKYFFHSWISFLRCWLFFKNYTSSKSPNMKTMQKGLKR